MTVFNWSIRAMIGPETVITAAAPPMDVEATDTIHITVGKKQGSVATVQTVELQPGPAAAVRLLVVQSSVYDKSNLSIKFKDPLGPSGQQESPSIALSAPQVFWDGILTLINVKPVRIEFTNKTDADIDVRVVVVRAATLS